ncbi:LysM peptidoglycan-binding domain-containing protein [Candidatus Vallotia lariciata]|uniref:LysM peptidoglycan-binding domain-containing protein n=1 Tax=Candidatus Vallotia laricis TaxID=2018052 RepID=UPI001D028DD3|nr:LysM peptidoglycan-binding domain-containing protein [Candidatus Vallotia lariciata]UDG83113.1 hypothetical protein GKR41_00490 [Candidatus Vallotia lariciata]
MNANLVKVEQTIFIVALLVMLTACSMRPEQPTPIIDHSTTLLSGSGVTVSIELSDSPAPLGYYRVKLGDTLYRIALENNQNYRDIALWNNLTNTLIKIDQLLLVVPPKTNISHSSRIVSKTNSAAYLYDSRQ